MKKMISVFALILALMLMIAGLPVFADTASASAAYSLEDCFTKRDLSGEWDADEAVTITLTGESAEAASDAVTIDGGVVTITAAGAYALSGTLSDGSVVVNAGDDDKVQLVLDGVDITSSNSAAILVENADKVFITLVGENSLANGGSFDENSNVDAVIFARDDITLNGEGSLTITSPDGHGIVGKDDVKLVSGTYNITASGRGVDANDSLLVAGGSYAIVSGKDAIRAKNDEDASEGTILIFDGEFNLIAGGGATNGATHAEGMMGFGRQAASVNEGSSVSTKGIKASGDLTILGGSFVIDTADDALHTDANLTIEGGSLTLSSGDDGLHANSAVTIGGGTLNITRSYEGIEGQTITLNGGDIKLTASDDGLNAAGGADGSGYGFYDMFASQDGVAITINGGSLYVNAQGDGIDSNGSLYVNGGATVVSGPTNSGNGALDYNGTGAITGGTFIAAGASGMVQNFGSGSTQVSALVSLNGQGGAITVTDASGNVILTAEVDKSYNCVVVSSPELQVGQTYTVSNGTGSAELNATDTIVGSGSGMGGFGGGRGQRGGMGGWNGQQGMTQDGQMPSEGQIPSDGQAPADGQIPSDGQPGFGGMQPPQGGGFGGPQGGGMGGPQGGGRRG